MEGAPVFSSSPPPGGNAEIARELLVMNSLYPSPSVKLIVKDKEVPKS